MKMRNNGNRFPDFTNLYFLYHRRDVSSSEVDFEKIQLTSGRLRLLIAVSGLDSDPIGIRILRSKTSLDVNGKGKDFVCNF